MSTKLKIIAGVLTGLLLGTGSIAFAAGTILFPVGGGTGTSTAPIYGQVLVGNAGGTYTLTATSSLGISGGSGTNYLTLTGNKLQNNVGTGLGINVAPNTAALEVQGTTSDATASGLAVWNSSASPLLIVKNSGNVGIATSSPARLLTLAFNNVNTGTSPFDIDQQGTGNAWLNFSIGSAKSYAVGMTNTGLFQIAYSSTAVAGLPTNPRLTIDTSGNVGIGTTTPIRPLTVVNSVDTSPVSVFINTSIGGGTGGGGMFGYTSFLPAASGDRLSYFGGGYTDGSNLTNAAIMLMYATQAWTVGAAQGSAIAFETTANGAAARTERLRIDQNGNVGVGTTTPNTKLTIAASNANGINLDKDTGTAGNSARLFFTGLSGSSIYQNGNNLLFNYGAVVGSNSGTAGFVLTNTGLVGIGTTTPATALDIKGVLQVEASGAAVLIDPYGASSDQTYFNFVSNRAQVGYNGTTGNLSLQGNTGKGIEFVVNTAGFGSGTASAILTSAGLFGVGTTSPWRLLSVGTGNAGTFAISTSTAGCAQFSSMGELYSTGTACGTGAGGVTSVTGTYPIISSGGSTPAISLAFGTTTANTWGGTQTFTNSPIFSTLTGGPVNANPSGTLYNTATSSVSSGTGISFSGTPGALVGGSNLTITNSGVTSAVAGTGISVSGATGAVTFTNTGLLSLAQTYGTTQTGAITFATTTDSFNGLQANEMITNTGGAFTFSNLLSGILNVTGGGTGVSSLASGHLLYGSGSTAMTDLGPGTAGQVLGIVGGVPAWVATSTPISSNYFTNSGASTYLSTGTNLGIGTTSPTSLLSIDNFQVTSPFVWFNTTKAIALAGATTTYSSGQTWTKPANLNHITVIVIGGGGGGGGASGGNTGGTGGAGAASSFTYNSGGNTVTGNGGTGAGTAPLGTAGGGGGAGGTASGGDTNTTGSTGTNGSGGGPSGGTGGTASGQGGGGVPSAGGGTARGAGGGGGNTNTQSSGGGGGGGGFAEKTVLAANLGATETIVVGGGGGGGGGNHNAAGNAGNASGSTGGTAGTGSSLGSNYGGAGGNGGANGSAGQASGSNNDGGGGGAGGYVQVGFYYNATMATTTAFTISNITGTDASGNSTSTPALGIGTSTPAAALSVFSSENIIREIISGLILGTTYIFQEIDSTGHRITGGPTPTLSSCGSTNNISGNDNNGTIMFTGTLVTACTMSFANAVSAGQNVGCQVSGNSTVGFPTVTSTSTTAIVFGVSQGISADTLYYQCERYQ